MKERSRTPFAIAGLLIAVLICGIVWKTSSRSEPTYDGKRLSVWLDELCMLNQQKRDDPSTPQVQAIRTIGTNAFPWLFDEFRRDRGAWQWKLNQLLPKQRFIFYRFPDMNS